MARKSSVKPTAGSLQPRDEHFVSFWREQTTVPSSISKAFNLWYNVAFVHFILCFSNGFWGLRGLRLFIVSLVSLSPQCLAHSRNARDICVMEENIKSTISSLFLYFQHQWNFQVSTLIAHPGPCVPLLSRSTRPPKCSSGKYVNVSVSVFAESLWALWQRDCLSYSSSRVQGSAQGLSHSRCLINICRIEVSDMTQIPSFECSDCYIMIYKKYILVHSGDTYIYIFTHSSYFIAPKTLRIS